MFEVLQVKIMVAADVLCVDQRWYWTISMLPGPGALHHGADIIEMCCLDLGAALPPQLLGALDRPYSIIKMRQALRIYMRKKLLKRLLEWYCMGNLAGSGQSRLKNSQSASVCVSQSPAKAGYAAAHITLLGVGLYVDVALTQWNGVFWTALQNHQSKQFYRPFGSNESAQRSMVRGFFVFFCFR